MQFENSRYPNLNELKGILQINTASSKKVNLNNTYRVMALLLFILIIALAFVLACVPWVQTIYGTGRIIAYSPNQRTQSIAAPIDGRIKLWHVIEGSVVKKGDKIAELEDIDPLFIKRIEQEFDAIQSKFDAMQLSVDTAKKNVDRQKLLFKEGLSSQRTLELAELEHAKFLSELSSTAAELAKIETRMSRQSSQSVTTPTDGVVQKITLAEGGAVIKQGQELALIVPSIFDRAAELWINGVDMPLLQLGRDVRLQFEGWPAVQFSGWPSVAVGTFGGKIALIDPSGNSNGNFRVLVVPDNKQDWPDTNYLRQGVRTVGWVLLDPVKLGWELWRKFNGFPPTINNKQKDFN